MQKLVWMGVVFLLVAGPLAAQGKKADTGQALAQKGEDAAQAVKKIPLPPVKEQLKRVPQSLKADDKHQKSIKRMLDDATAKQEVLRVDCLFDKWNQARGLQELARAGRSSFQQAHRQADRGEREHFYRKVLYLEGRIAELEQEAARCGLALTDEERGRGVEVIAAGVEDKDESDSGTELDYPAIPPVSPYR